MLKALGIIALALALEAGFLATIVAPPREANAAVLVQASAAPPARS